MVGPGIPYQSKILTYLRMNGHTPTNLPFRCKDDDLNESVQPLVEVIRQELNPIGELLRVGNHPNLADFVATMIFDMNLYLI